MASFFDKENKFSAYEKILQHNASEKRKKRLLLAEEALQEMKEDIASRTKNLQKVFDFLKTQNTHYQELIKQCKKNPSSELDKEINWLKQQIINLENKLKQKKPEKIIADLNFKYEQLKSTLTQIKNTP